MEEIYEEFKKSRKNFKTSTDCLAAIAEKRSLSVTTVKKAVSSGKKLDMTYNIDHKSEKDDFTNACIYFIVRDQLTILDAFAGKFSMYKNKDRCGFVNQLVVTSNDLNFPDNDYQLTAKELLKRFLKSKTTFDIIDLDAFNAQDAIESFPFAAQLANDAIFLTVGELTRCRHMAMVRHKWQIEFTDVETIPTKIYSRLEEILKIYKKRITGMSFIKFNEGTYRFCIRLKKG